MDEKGFYSGVVARGRLLPKTLVLLTVSLVCGVVAIAEIAAEPWKTIFIVLVSAVLTLCLSVALAYWALIIVRKKVIESGVSPAPPISPEDEDLASSSLVNKALASHFLVGVVGPLLSWVLVDLVTREMPAALAIRVTGIVYGIGTELAFFSIAVYLLAAKWYELKSGVFLSIDCFHPGSKYSLFRREIGLRKLAVLICLLFNLPVRFGMGWVLIVGLYLFISKNVI